MAVNWNAIQKAIQDFVVAASTLPATSVFWANQRNTRPSPPFITLYMDAAQSAGLYDEERISNNPTPTAGQEILVDTYAHVDSILKIQAFSKDVVGATSARALLSKVYNALSQESYLEALDVAGVVIADRGSIERIPALFEEDIEDRALLDVTIRYLDGTQEATTFIETVNVTKNYVP